VRKVRFKAISGQELIDLKVAEGIPDFVAKFALGWVQGMNNEEWDSQGWDLEKVVGQRLHTVAEFLRDEYVAKTSVPLGHEKRSFEMKIGFIGAGIVAQAVAKHVLPFGLSFCWLQPEVQNARAMNSVLQDWEMVFCASLALLPSRM
jgi:hypothetical protein